MSKGDKKAKFQRTTQEQLNFFVTFVKHHPELLAGKSNPASSSSPILRKLWKEIADNLNAMNGPTRSPFKWKDTMYHWRCQLRSRARKSKVHNTSIKENLDFTTCSKNYEQVVNNTSNEYTNPTKDIPSLGLKEIKSTRTDNSVTLLDLEEIMLKEEVENSFSPVPDLQNSDTTFEFEITEIEEESNMDFAKDVEDGVDFIRMLQIEDSDKINASDTQVPLTPAARILAIEPTITPSTNVKKKFNNDNVLQNIVTIIEKKEQWEQKYREDNLKTQISLALAMKTLGEGMKSMSEAIKSLNESLLFVYKIK